MKTQSLLDNNLPLDGQTGLENIEPGDMPGDKLCIGDSHVKRVGALLPALLPMLADAMAGNAAHRATVAVYGGSGVGKSEIAALLRHELRQRGIGSYVLSGDNYPHRIPRYNDAERLRVYRTGGLRRLLENGFYTAQNGKALIELQQKEQDADPALRGQYPWLAEYQAGGRSAVQGYLGTPLEQNFEEVSAILAQFKNGADAIWLKRMGRQAEEIWYDCVDFTATDVMIVEWTHGNSAYYQGADLPILLNSTPAQTLAHRKLRNRDGKTDAPFTTAVLEIEQELLKSQAHSAKLIVAQSGALLPYQEYLRQMTE